MCLTCNEKFRGHVRHFLRHQQPTRQLTFYAFARKWIFFWSLIYNNTWSKCVISEHNVITFRCLATMQLAINIFAQESCKKCPSVNKPTRFISPKSSGPEAGLISVDYCTLFTVLLTIIFFIIFLRTRFIKMFLLITQRHNVTRSFKTGQPDTKPKIELNWKNWQNC